MPDSVVFACAIEKNPPLDAQADTWYREARNLQKMNEERHFQTIVSLYERAIARNHYNAMHRLALLYVDGAEWFKPDERKAVDLIERVMKLNVASGYYQMGVYLQQGIGVQQNEASALVYMRKAADMGSPQAQLVLGRRLVSVSGQPERSHVMPIGESMLECALSQGLGEAGYRLGFHYVIGRKDSAKALRAFQEAGKLGDASSLYSLGQIFRLGRYGIPIDERRAECYERLWSAADADKTKRFPDLDRICPLPPSHMP